jgi:dihydrofolate synthase / folylpolyglutamate synthase
MYYQETIAYLYKLLPAFHLKGASAYKPGLGNTKRLMEALGNPHQKFKSVHIAGTNGKGSVSHYLSAVFQEAGYKTGLYTSPHLIDFGERIRINGAMIKQQYVIDFVARNHDLIATIQPSFFELTMAMSFSYFADNMVDIAVIETGLGGRLDSTNIITPELSIITNIGYDHMEFLGNSLPEIAAEKAGIIKENTAVVIGETLPETKQVFEAYAQVKNSDIYYSELYELPVFKGFEANKMKFHFQNKEYMSGLTGMYQLMNIRTVMRAIEVLQNSSFKISQQSIESGLRNVCEITGLRGRWEILRNNPLLIADTAHNSHGMSQLNENLRHYDYYRLRIIIGMVKDKDLSAVIKCLPLDAIYYFTKAQTERSLSETELQNKAAEAGLRGYSYENIICAMDSALNVADERDIILITGSNFVVGEALEVFEKRTI